MGSRSGEGFDLVRHDETVLPTWYINPDRRAIDASAANDNPNNGGGDFSTFIGGNHRFAFVSFPYAPGDPNTSVLDTYFAKIPLTLMHG